MHQCRAFCIRNRQGASKHGSSVQRQAGFRIWQKQSLKIMINCFLCSKGCWTLLKANLSTSFDWKPSETLKTDSFSVGLIVVVACLAPLQRERAMLQRTHWETLAKVSNIYQTMDGFAEKRVIWKNFMILYTCIVFYCTSNWIFGSWRHGIKLQPVFAIAGYRI